MNRDRELQLLPAAGFAAIFSGIMTGIHCQTPMFLLHLVIAIVPGWLLFRANSRGCRFGRKRLVRTVFLPGAAFPASFLFLVLLGGGAFLGSTVAVSDDVLAPLSGSEVRAMVTITDIRSRDALGVRAIGVLESVTGLQGLLENAAGRTVSIWCAHERGQTDASGCRFVRNGLTVAVRGSAGYSRRIGSYLSLSGDAVSVEVARSDSGIRGLVDSWRSRMSFLCIERLPGAASWLVPALVLGEGGGVPSGSRNALSVLGTAHLVSVSGLHVVTVSGAVGLLVFVLLGLPASRLPLRFNAAMVASLSTVACAWLVALVAGMPPPAVRAAGVASLWAMSRLLSRFPAASSVVCSAGILEMLFWPADAGTVSFQLSYAAVFGIMLAGRLMPVKRRGAGFRGLAVSVVRSSLIVSIGASLATIPLTIIYFGSAPLVGPLANLVVVPMFTIVGLPGAFLTVILLRPETVVGSGVGGLAIWAYCYAADLMMGIQDYASRYLPPILAWPPWPLDVLMAASCAGIVTFLALSRTRIAVAVALVVTTVLVLVPDWRQPVRGQVVFLDVGKGDAAVLRCPSGSVWLVDAGAPDRGRSPLADALSRNRVRDIDGVVVTHAHDDHYGGIPMLLDRFGAFNLAASKSTIEQMP